jgi:hypothetical protein
MPKSDNRSCSLGLRLDLVSKQETELVDIGHYSTTREICVNDPDITQLNEGYAPNVTRMGNSISSSSE